MRKMRMQLAEVLEAGCEPNEAHKAQLQEAVGQGYGVHESGKRLLRLHAA